MCLLCAVFIRIILFVRVFTIMLEVFALNVWLGGSLSSGANEVVVDLCYVFFVLR